LVFSALRIVLIARPVRSESSETDMFSNPLAARNCAPVTVATALSGSTLELLIDK
jgi:hypothetical protein